MDIDNKQQSYAELEEQLRRLDKQSYSHCLSIYQDLERFYESALTLNTCDWHDGYDEEAHAHQSHEAQQLYLRLIGLLELEKQARTVTLQLEEHFDIEKWGRRDLEIREITQTRIILAIEQLQKAFDLPSLDTELDTPIYRIGMAVLCLTDGLFKLQIEPEASFTQGNEEATSSQECIAGDVSESPARTDL